MNPIHKIKDELELNSIFSKACNSYFSEYKKILINLYPKEDSNGFEERNMSNNFVIALKKSLKDKEAISWFEMSWIGKEKVDSVLFSPKHKSVFFVEAKRFSNGNLSNKRNLINNDFYRILNNANQRERVINRHKAGVTSFDKQFIVCLIDVWAEKKSTSDIPATWLPTFLKMENEKICENVFFCPIPFSNGNNNYSHKCINKYNLLVLIYKIDESLTVEEAMCKPFETKTTETKINLK